MNKRGGLNTRDMWNIGFGFMFAFRAKDKKGSDEKETKIVWGTGQGVGKQPIAQNL